MAKKTKGRGRSSRKVRAAKKAPFIDDRATEPTLDDRATEPTLDGSRRSSRPPPPTLVPRETLEIPGRRSTMEVDMSWLEPEESPQPAPKKGPPPLPPPRRETLEVEADWLEKLDDATRAVVDQLPLLKVKPKGNLPVTIPREEPKTDPPPRSPKKRR